MLVGPLPIRPVFTHNQFYVVASFLHNIWWLPFHFRLSFFSGFTLRSVSRDNFTFFDIWREFYLRVAVLVRKIVL